MRASLTASPSPEESAQQLLGTDFLISHLRAQGWEKNPRQRELAGGKLPAPSEAEGTCSEARPALVTLQGEPQGEAL